MQKLHQTGNQVEVALNEYCIGNIIFPKSGTEPGQKSLDDFWVGDGAGEECCNHALDGQGTAVGDDALETKPTVSKHSLAHKQRCDWNKQDARMFAAGLQILASNNALDESQIIVMEEPLQDEEIVAMAPHLTGFYQDNMPEGQF